jgi:hypothetical protein
VPRSPRGAAAARVAAPRSGSGVAAARLAPASISSASSGAAWSWTYETHGKKTPLPEPLVIRLSAQVTMTVSGMGKVSLRVVGHPEGIEISSRTMKGFAAIGAASEGGWGPKHAGAPRTRATGPTDATSKPLPPPGSGKSASRAEPHRVTLVQRLKAQELAQHDPSLRLETIKDNGWQLPRTSVSGRELRGVAEELERGSGGRTGACDAVRLAVEAAAAVRSDALVSSQTRAMWDVSGTVGGAGGKLSGSTASSAGAARTRKAASRRRAAVAIVPSSRCARGTAGHTASATRLAMTPARQLPRLVAECGRRGKAAVQVCVLALPMNSACRPSVSAASGLAATLRKLQGWSEAASGSAEAVSKRAGSASAAALLDARGSPLAAAAAASGDPAFDAASLLLSCCRVDCSAVSVSVLDCSGAKGGPALLSHLGAIALPLWLVQGSATSAAPDPAREDVVGAGSMLFGGPIPGVGALRRADTGTAALTVARAMGATREEAKAVAVAAEVACLQSGGPNGRPTAATAALQVVLSTADARAGRALAPGFAFSAARKTSLGALNRPLARDRHGEPSSSS